MLNVNNMSFEYSNQKGVFDINFSLEQGEVLGFLGPNGAGKTTTIRALMGFIKPTKGSLTIFGKDCFEKADEIQKNVGYIAGEVNFINGLTAKEYLDFVMDMRGLKNTSNQKILLDMFELSLNEKIKNFSKGMKQKLSIVSAFMHDPQVLILDEPTSGLDPLMQNRFVELILSEKEKGKTILMSSHMFEEVERCCQNTLIIKNGRITCKSSIQSLKNKEKRIYTVKSDNLLALEKFGYNLKSVGDKTAEIQVDNVDKFVKDLAQLNVLDLQEKSQSLENFFMNYYGGGENT
ncbi:MAG: ABC transporter ATP-binding protein [Clostridia bacterium]